MLRACELRAATGLRSGRPDRPGPGAEWRDYAIAWVVEDIKQKALSTGTARTPRVDPCDSPDETRYTAEHSPDWAGPGARERAQSPR